MLMMRKEKCEQKQEITAIETSDESHLYWKDRFHKNSLYFMIYAAFETDNEIDNTFIGNKTTNVYKQNPVLNGCYVISELDDFLESCHYESPLVYNIVDCFFNEVIRLENKMAFYFKILRKISL